MAINRLKARQAVVADRSTAVEPKDSPERNSGKGTNSMKSTPPGTLNAISSGKAPAKP
jgi:hypothetical protein